VLVASELKGWVLGGGPLTSLARYGESRVLTPDLAFAGRPMALGLLARWCTRGACYLEDERGRRQKLTVGQLARWGGQVLGEIVTRGAFVRRVERDVEAEERALATRRPPPLDLTRPCAYFRTDLAYSVKAGGSVGHIAGVLNALHAFGHRPVFITTDHVATVAADVETHVVPRSPRFWHYRELPAMVMHDVFVSFAHQVLSTRPLSFIYQRYSVHDFAGVVLARRLNVPLVIEYNGPENWVGRHWGRELRYSALADRIELLNMRAADLVVVVSDVNREDLVSRGIDAGRILVNPNGVDVERYRPEIDGRAVRARYGLDTSLVVGFIGTFGPWHGAEILSEAFARLLSRRPELKQQTRLLMIGDGVRAGSARRILEASGHADAAVWTGLVPQAEGPQYLAACDVLVSPHVPNPDGSRFFGSPTKLFEYMAMGRAIVASDLEQIGEILAHDHTASLVPPGDVDALARAIEQLVADPERRARLGEAARSAAVSRWSWREHTRRIVARLSTSERHTPAAVTAERS
jgi:glycosyltransferase involved in cell wall biosynthesis